MSRGRRSVLSLAAAILAMSAASAAIAADFVVKPVTIPEMKAVFGQVESRTIVPARARNGGTIAAISVAEGSLVTEGAVIGRVVDDKLKLQQDAAEARVQQADAQLAKAVADLDRAQQLIAKGVTSQAQLDQARSAHDVALNQLSAAEADRAVVVQQTREGDILAPATGRVLTVPVTLGSVVMAGDTIARVASGRYYLRLSLPERHAATIHDGDSVMIGGRGLGAAVAGATAPLREGRIAKIYPEISDGRVTADVDVADLGDYFIGERILVSIPVGSREALAIPADAVTSGHGIDTVRLASGGTTSVILGEVFAIGSAQQVEVLTGLQAGDTIITPDSQK